MFPPPQILISIFRSLCVFPFTKVPQSLSPNPTVLSALLYLDTLLSASPFTGSHLCTTDSLISPGFVLLQRGVGCPSGITLIAVWEHRIGLLSTSPFLYFSLIIFYSHSYPPACLNATYILFIFPFFFWIFFPSRISFSPTHLFYFDAKYPQRTLKTTRTDLNVARCDSHPEDKLLFLLPWWHPPHPLEQRCVCVCERSQSN